MKATISVSLFRHCHFRFHRRHHTHRSVIIFSSLYLNPSGGDIPIMTAKRFENLFKLVLNGVNLSAIEIRHVLRCFLPLFRLHLRLRIGPKRPPYHGLNSSRIDGQTAILKGRPDFSILGILG
jgi:hypothetical protein